MDILRAEDARQIAMDNSALLQTHLDSIYKLIGQVAKEGGFSLNYFPDNAAVNLVAPIKDQLSQMGYDVTSSSLTDINLRIKW